MSRMTPAMPIGWISGGMRGTRGLRTHPTRRNLATRSKLICYVTLSSAIEVAGGSTEDSPSSDGPWKSWWIWPGCPPRRRILQPLKYILSLRAARRTPRSSHIWRWAAYLKEWGGPVARRAAFRLYHHPRRYAINKASTATTASRPRASPWRPREGAGRLHDRPDQAGGAAPDAGHPGPSMRSCWSSPWASPASRRSSTRSAPAETSSTGGTTTGVHHVPKRSLKEIIIG